MHNQPVVRRRAGRKMQVGRWVLNQRTGQSGVFLGYTDDLDVDGKVIINRDFLTEVARFVRKDEKSRSRRILEFLLQGRLI